MIGNDCIMGLPAGDESAITSSPEMSCFRGVGRMLLVMKLMVGGCYLTLEYFVGRFTKRLSPTFSHVYRASVVTFNSLRDIFFFRF